MARQPYLLQGKQKTLEDQLSKTMAHVRMERHNWSFRPTKALMEEDLPR